MFRKIFLPFIILVLLFTSVFSRFVYATLASDEHLEMVKDINTAGDGGTYNYAEYNSKIYFSATDSTHGNELWVTDGTESGTTLVKDINPGISDGTPSQLIAFNNQLYFFADDGTHGYELWKTDGTDAGTVMVKDLNAGSGWGVTYDEGSSFIFDQTLFFKCNDGAHGWELCKSDGTQGGTTLLKDINIGSGSGFGSSYAQGSAIGIYNGEMFFPADDGTHGYELWKTDGTEGGTSLVKDIRSGASSSFDTFYYSFVSLSNGCMFIADDGIHGFEPWFSDGTTGGTVLPKDINPAGDSLDSFTTLNAYSGRAIFTATDGSHGAEPWISDGTVSGTTMIKDIYSGSSGSGADRYLSTYHGKLYFRANNGVHGKELWSTDGTEAGTTTIEISSDGSGSYANPVGVVNDELILIATDTYYQDPDTYEETANFELWRTDGTQGGTSLIHEINSSGSSIPIYQSKIIGNRIYFNGNDGVHGLELWSYWVDDPSPTPTPTVAVTPTPTPTTAECTTSKPTSPDLFQVDRSGSSMTVHFTPLSDEMSAYQVSYGTNEDGDGAVEQISISKSDGAIAYTISSLDSTKTYYTKVRGKRDCKEGDWSSTKKAAGPGITTESRATTRLNSASPKKTVSSSKKASTIKNGTVKSKKLSSPIKKKTPSKLKKCFLLWCW